MTTLLYAFTQLKYNNISAKILKDLNSQEKFLVNCDSNEIAIEEVKKLIEKIKTEKTKYIIGLGEYGGRDNDKLRIETVAKSRFRNNPLGEAKQHEISSFLVNSKIPGGFKTATAMGNSFCNLSAYMIADAIKVNKLDSEVAFIHIPQNSSTVKAVNLIKFIL